MLRARAVGLEETLGGACDLGTSAFSPVLGGSVGTTSVHVASHFPWKGFMLQCAIDS